MYEWREAKISGKLRRAFLVANDIAWLMDDEKIRSAYLVMAAMNDVSSPITNFLEEAGIPMYLIKAETITSNRELYEEVFGKEAAERYFTEEKNEQPLLITTEDIGGEDDEVTNKLVNALNIFANKALAEEQMSTPNILIPVYSDKLEEACDNALKMCNIMKTQCITLEVLLYSILQNKETSGYKIMKVFLESLNIPINHFINSIKLSYNICDINEEDTSSIVIPTSLENCLELLNAKYKKGEISPILGRDKEIFKAFNIFSKKTKRNAVLVGEPGVGKTAIIEAITQQIVNETCPKEFIGYNVLSLDINAMLAGTTYRGQFEEKVAILKKFLQNTPNVILFVDEMHEMMGAGAGSEGTVDLSGSLKPVLSRDDVVFVGATTTNEYNRILSRDGAFKRRFEVITIKEPKNDEVKSMIKAKIKIMEKYHGVKMPSKLIDYIILCSNCFNMESCNPDRTLDLCDRSMAIAKMENHKTVSKLHIEKVYDEYFTKYCKLDKKLIESVAYHELGHYIVTRLTKESEDTDIIAVSIIPGNGFMGINVLEEKDNQLPCDMEYAESYIMSLLAGRVSQYKFSKCIDSGASKDLMMAKRAAKKLISEFGMDDEEYKNIYLMDEELFNEKLATKIDEKANQLIKKLYSKTEAFVDAHFKEIENMAKYLVKNKIATSDELDKFIIKEQKNS